MLAFPSHHRLPAVAAAAAVAALACTPGTPSTPSPWSATSGPALPTAGCSAASLAGGDIIVVGGELFEGRGFHPVGQTARYDPRRGTWTSSGDLATPRAYATATPLADGGVLVVGGLGGGDLSVVLGDAERYDPIAGAFRPAAPLHTARWLHLAVPLLDGRVLVVGGAEGLPGPQQPPGLSSAELYDPAVDAWTPAGELGWEIVFAAAAALPDGDVLVTGGAISARSKRFHPADATWAEETPMSAPRWGHTATLLADGRVLVVGGPETLNGGPSSAEIYDPGARSWTAAAPPIAPGRFGGRAVLLAGGDVLLAGGGALSASGRALPSLLSSAERYDPRTGAWHEAGVLAEGRNEPELLPLEDGGALVVCGALRNAAINPGPAERYDP